MMEGRVGGGEIEQPEGLREEDEDDENGGNQRLGTIGEDGDEDKHIYDTNQGAGKTQQSKKTGGEASAAALKAEKSGDAQYEDDYEF
jgi:hypothetical protein